MWVAALSNRDRGRVRDLSLQLATAGAAGSDTPLTLPIVAELGDLLACEYFAANRPALDEQGSWGPGPLVSTREAFSDAYVAALPSVAVPFPYAPLRPAADQRNGVFLFADLHAPHSPDAPCISEVVWPRVGVGGYDQIRVLVCDGPTLLAWVGGWRADPFTERERALYAALVPALQRNLALHRRLQDAQLATAGLDAALDALGAPAFIARASGEVVHASASGRELLERHPRDTRATLRDAIAHPTPACFTARLPDAGLPDCHLVILRDHDGTLDGRLREASRRWRLTPREREVLRLVVDGDAGKEIAVKLLMHERSVERHVTNLLRKARCDSRSRLIARFWTRL